MVLRYCPWRAPGRPDLQYVPRAVPHCIHAHLILLATVHSPAPSASTALDIVTSPLDVTILTSQLRPDPCLGAFVFVNFLPRPCASALVRPTRSLPTCIRCSRHPMRGLWRPHLRKRNDIAVQTMLREDSHRYSISPTPGLWLSAVRTDSDGKIQKGVEC